MQPDRLWCPQCEEWRAHTSPWYSTKLYCEECETELFDEPQAEPTDSKEMLDTSLDEEDKEAETDAEAEAEGE